MDCSTSVSYTHLDVYKRQALKWSIRSNSQASRAGPVFVYALPLENLVQSMSGANAQPQTADLGAEGSFEGLAPGRYLVIALDHAEPLPYREADVAQRYLSLGQEVTLTPVSYTHLDVYKRQ